MTPVFQTSIYDCLSACVASVLDLPLADIPLWWELTGDAWLHAISSWAAERDLGVCYFSLKNRQDWPMIGGCYVIVGGSTPRSDKYFHAVVARAEWTGEETRLHWLHDPCPTGEFIIEPDHCLVFIPRKYALTNSQPKIEEVA